MCFHARSERARERKKSKEREKVKSCIFARTRTCTLRDPMSMSRENCLVLLYYWSHFSLSLSLSLSLALLIHITDTICANTHVYSLYTNLNFYALEKKRDRANRVALISRIAWEKKLSRGTCRLSLSVCKQRERARERVMLNESQWPIYWVKFSFIIPDITRDY